MRLRIDMARTDEPFAPPSRGPLPLAFEPLHQLVLSLRFLSHAQLSLFLRFVCFVSFVSSPIPFPLVHLFRSLHFLSPSRNNITLSVSVGIVNLVAFARIEAQPYPAHQTLLD